MTITIVQSVTGSGSTITLTGVAAGNLLTLQTSYYRNPQTGATEAIPTDTQGTWSTGSTGATGQDAVGETSGSIFYQANVASGTHTVTPQANPSKNLTLIEWAGATTTPLDVAANAKTSTPFSGTSQATGTTGTTAQADELVLISLGLAATNGVTDVGFTDPVSGFTTAQKVSNDFSNIGTFHAYKTISSTGTQSATFNWTDTETLQFCGAVIATFKAAAAVSTVIADYITGSQRNRPGRGPYSLGKYFRPIGETAHVATGGSSARGASARRYYEMIGHGTNV